MATTPERWDELDRAWRVLLERPEPERAGAIDELCAEDQALGRDLKSLFAHLERASAAGFGAAPIGVPDGREWLVGRQLGPYAVHTLLGAGGMGEVFQATDSTLGREVALKILPDRWLADQGRHARFEQEARLLASLNHPNIGSIHGVHDSDGVRALVLELVEGATLADRLSSRGPGAPRRRGLPVADVVTIASQMLDALEAAHSRGIVHRDLKPANVKITPDMRVKVLDFGLAFAMDGTDHPANAASSTAMPDASLHEGALIGTPAYMSPEQARGRAVDTRTDIWAFGCVLYEMLTGTQAFVGDDVGQVLAYVISRQPDMSVLPADTPRALRLCVRRCLQKDPAKRFHHVADVRLALEGAFEPEIGDQDGMRQSRRTGVRTATAGWVVAAFMTIVAAGAIAVALRSALPAPATPVVEATGAAPTTPPVQVNRRIGGGGSAIAQTIQGALDIASRGATVTVLPGVYAESLTITRGVTLVGFGGRSREIIVAPTAAAEAVIDIRTSDPVIIRDLTLQVRGAHGIRGTGVVDVTVEQSRLLALDPPPDSSALIRVGNDMQLTGGRARVVVQGNLLDGSVTRLPVGIERPRSHAVQLVGDLDGVVRDNTMRRTGGICVDVSTRPDFGGHTNVEIAGNDIDECHPYGRVSAIKVGSPGVGSLSPEHPVTATGLVNIIGNTIRNSSEDCLNSAIAFDVYSGRIERNHIVDFVRPCAGQNPRNMAAAIWLGLRKTDITVPTVTPVVRLNDIHGNAHAGLRVGPNQKGRADATCNYWGSDRGPSGVGPGTGDAIVVESGAPAPRFSPFATAPIAKSDRAGC
jgi:hypothetical protein